MEEHSEEINEPQSGKSGLNAHSSVVQDQPVRFLFNALPLRYVFSRICSPLESYILYKTFLTRFKLRLPLQTLDTDEQQTA